MSALNRAGASPRGDAGGEQVLVASPQALKAGPPEGGARASGPSTTARSSPLRRASEAHARLDPPATSVDPAMSARLRASAASERRLLVADFDLLRPELGGGRHRISRRRCAGRASGRFVGASGRPVGASPASSSHSRDGSAWPSSRARSPGRVRRRVRDAASNAKPRQGRDRVRLIAELAACGGLRSSSPSRASGCAVWARPWTFMSKRVLASA